MAEYDQKAANVSEKTLLIEQINRADEHTSENGYDVNADLTKLNGTDISDENPLPVRDLAYNTETGNLKTENSGGIPKVEGGTETFFEDTEISEDTNSTTFTGARNYDSFLVEIEASNSDDDSEIVYTLKHRTDEGENYYTVKDKYGNDCIFTCEILLGGDPQSNLWEIEGYYQNMRLEAERNSGTQTATAKCYPANMR